MNKTILHFDIDAFFASVEQIRNPRLKGKPVIVGAGVIASCSYEARKYGLHAGMSLTNAKKLCPNAYILEGNCQIYRCVADRIFEMCHKLSPSIETYLDEAYCDLSGMNFIYGNDITIPAKKLKDKIKNQLGLNTTIGIGENRMIAKMASKSAKPNGFRMIKEEENDQFISNLPVKALPGVGRKAELIFTKFNIRTIKEIRNLSKDNLQILFGKNGIAIYERCRGRDSQLINERKIPRSISRETTFHNDTTNSNEIKGMISYLAERAMKTMRELKLITKTVKLKIKYSDFYEDSTTKRLLDYTNVDNKVIDALMNGLETIFKRRVGLRLVGVTLSNFRLETTYQQLQLFDTENSDIKKLKLCRSIDSIRDKYGFSSIIMGESINLSGDLDHGSNGYILRTPSLTK